MGVTLQTYRIRVGTFNSANIKLGTSRSKSKKVQPWPMGLKSRTLLAFLFIFSALSWFHQFSTGSLSPGSHHTSYVQEYTGSTYLNTPSSYNLLHLQKSVALTLNHSSYFWLSRKQRNSLIKSLNGNRKQRGHGIKISHWNKGPSYLQNKHQEIETIIAGHQPHMLGLSEANLWAEHDQHLVQHTDYNLHVCSTIDNPDLGVSRVVVYTHNSLVVTRRPELESNTLSAIWLEVGLPRQKKILVCHAYREWQHLRQGDSSSSTVPSQLERWLAFLDNWEKALQTGKEVIVMMDANLDFLKWARTDLPSSDPTHRLRPLIDQLFSRILPLGVSQLVCVPTRVWAGQQASGLDHLYTNKQDKLSEVYTEFSGGSDHRLIKVTRYAKSMKRNPRYVKKRCYKKFSAKDFSEAVKKVSWWELYMCEDATKAAEILTTKLSNILDIMAPIKTIQVRTKYAAWLSSDTKELMQKRNKAQEVASNSNDPDEWRLYKNLRNTVNSRIKSEKKEWEKQKLDSTSNDTNNLWKNVKTWIDWNNSGPPSQLFNDGRLINSPAGIAGTMNNFFINKVRLLRQKIPIAQTDPMAKLRETLNDRTCKMAFQSVKPEEVLKIIRGLKNSKSTGTDFMDTSVIKLVAEDILPAVTHIINLSLGQSLFPSIWKQAKVVPLLKKGDPLNPKNYRQ